MSVVTIITTKWLFLLWYLEGVFAIWNISRNNIVIHFDIRIKASNSKQLSFCTSFSSYVHENTPVSSSSCCPNWSHNNSQFFLVTSLLYQICNPTRQNRCRTGQFWPSTIFMHIRSNLLIFGFLYKMLHKYLSIVSKWKYNKIQFQKILKAFLKHGTKILNSFEEKVPKIPSNLTANEKYFSNIPHTENVNGLQKRPCYLGYSCDMSPSPTPIPWLCLLWKYWMKILVISKPRVTFWYHSVIVVCSKIEKIQVCLYCQSIVSSDFSVFFLLIGLKFS